MANPNDDKERVELAFRPARRELAEIGSCRDEIDRRLAATSIQKSSKLPFASVSCTVALIASIALFAWHSRKAPPSPPGSVFVSTPAMPQESRAEMGDAELIEHLAAIVNHNVVIIWSYSGAGMKAMPAKLAEHPAGKYRSLTLREIKLANGRTMVCSLLTPDAGIKPVLEPPSIYARSDDNRVMSLSVSPRAASARELADAIRSAGGIDAENVLRDIQLHIHQ